MDNNFKPIAKPTSSTVLEAAKRDVALSMNCIQIGEIQSYDPVTQLSNVKVSMKQIISIAEDGTKTLEEYPLLMECPTLTLFGGVDFMSMPITAGDSCIVLFNDRDIDYWVNNGSGGTPTTSRLHDLSDAIAIVGIRSINNAIANILVNGIRLSHGGGNSQIDLTDNLIQSIATLFIHTGDMEIQGNLSVTGNLMTGTDGGTNEATLNGNYTVNGNLTADTLNAENGATGTFGSVQVVKGIVISGS